MRSSSCFGFGLLLLIAAPALAQAPPQPARPAVPPNFEVGFEERVRSESWDNLTDYSEAREDARHQWRFRTRAWVKAPLWSTVDLFVGVNNEAKNLATPDLPMSRDELVFENLYLDIRATKRSTFRVGRQNVMRGEGFILLDGNPLDGSRSLYSNAISFTHAFRPKATLELLGIANPTRDTYLPIVGDARKRLVERDEAIAGAYYTDRRGPDMDVQTYYLYKVESDDYRPATDAQHQPDRRVHTVGGRLARTIAEQWTTTGEMALQWGSQSPGTSVRGWGGYGYVKRAFGSPWQPAVTVGAIALSGDDPDTQSIEDFTPVLGRWPKWSELYIYSQAAERGAAYWTNTWMWHAEVTAKPARPLTLRGTYYHMGAFHPWARTTAMFAQGTTRGDMFQARADISLAGLLSGHLLYERLLPGSFYQGRDGGHFLRFEVSRTFRSTHAIRALLQ